ncbi:MAG: hypothetical protein CSB47_06590 [Proteobacteria bacterium]|nr:MAG: hypothetical protein CSB47_06590 [Pseudomonadota bacterium]
MPFNEFIAWLRGLFGGRIPPEIVTPTRPTETSPEPEPSAEDDPVAQQQDATSPIVEPTTPAIPPSPRIIAVDTDTDKVPLNQDVVFQVTTRPFAQYQGCTLDLSNTSGAVLVKDIDSNGCFTIRFTKASNTDNDTQAIRVSNADSTVDKRVTVSLMRLFWSNHPGRKNICDETRFANQCAIRMGSALEQSGIKIPLDRRILRRCTTEYRIYKHHKNGLVNGHILAAQELANWINTQTSLFGRRNIVHSKEEILGRSGVIFFRDGWGTTDHIDVWDGASLVGGFPSYFDADFKELWFWDIY